MKFSFPCNASRLTVFVFLLLLAWIFPVSAFCGQLQNTIDTDYKILPSGQVEVRYEFRNTGDETARHVRIATFLALEADQSGSLGDNAPGGTLRYGCVLTPSLKPGQYVLVTRVHFEDIGGTQHQLYHFNTFPYRTDSVEKGRDAVAAELTEPSFNVKGFLGARSATRITLQNHRKIPARAIVNFYLPEGFTTQAPQRIYDLAPGERKEEDIPFRMERAFGGTYRFHAVVWHEGNDFHHAQRIEKRIHVEERPVYFRAFLFLAGFVLVVMVFLWRRKLRN